MNASNLSAAPDISIVVPAYNKESCISITLKEIIRVVSSTKYSFEIIVIDDFSSDKTLLEIEKISAPELKILRNFKNFGKGFSIRRGIQFCSAKKFIGYVDADLDIEPDALLLAISCLEQHKDIEICIGSKFHSSSVVRVSKLRRIQSRGFATLFRFLFRLEILDSQSGLKLGRANSLRFLTSRVSTRGFAFDVELLFLAHKCGLLMKEIPIKLRGNYLTTINLTSSVRSILDLFVIRFRLSRLKTPRQNSL